MAVFGGKRELKGLGLAESVPLGVHDGSRPCFGQAVAGMGSRAQPNGTE